MFVFTLIGVACVVTSLLLLIFALVVSLRDEPLDLDTCCRGCFEADPSLCECDLLEEIADQRCAHCWFCGHDLMPDTTTFVVVDGEELLLCVDRTACAVRNVAAA